MIHVQRTPPSQALYYVLRNAELRVRKEFHARRGVQSRFEFSATEWHEAAPQLFEAFHGKCAYCETPLSPKSFNVDHFRPKLGAMDLDHQIDPNHYYWLAYDWSNLYPGCGECEGNKKTMFPVDGERAALGESVAKESPLLLDPCIDEPSQHLRFLRNGQVVARSSRGAASIELLGLNRRSLIHARVKAVEEALTRHGKGAALLKDPGLPYLGAIWSVLSQPRASVKAALKKKTTKQPAAPPLRMGGFLKRVELKNFKGIEHLSLNLVPSQGDDKAGWLMLLGENAAGKSSILQAVALALVGNDGAAAFTQTSLDAMVRNNVASATITLETSAEPATIRVRLQRGRRPKFLEGPEGYPGLVLGYGATRLAADDAEQSTTSNVRRVLNLFNPRVQLTPAEPWLLGLKTEAFNDAAKSLKSLLRITTVETPLSIVDGRVWIDHGNGPVRIDQLSAGYHSMLGLGVDIMQASPAQTTDKAYVSGIVILDEIDAHLHPRWKMDVVGLLRAAFPLIQFITSTHEPLCLRGTKEKEVVLMRTDENKRVEAVTKLPPHETMRVDQLLTSPLFGLHTTLDPDIEKLFAEYYGLLAKPKVDPKEKARIQDLKQRLSRHGVLGYTRRDQMIYEYIDKYLAREPVLTAKRRAALQKETREKVLAIWRRVAPGSGS